MKRQHHLPRIAAEAHSPDEKERMFQASFRDWLLRTHVDGLFGECQQQKQLDQYCDDNFEEERPPVVLFGSPGCGKSSFLASWTSQRSKKNAEDGIHTVEYFVGTNRDGRYLGKVLYNIVYELVEGFGLPKHLLTVDEKLLVKRFPQVLSQVAAKGKLLLVIDNISNVLCKNGKPAGLSWIPWNLLTKNIRIIVSMTIANQLQLEQFSKLTKQQQNKYASETATGEPSQPVDTFMTADEGGDNNIQTKLPRNLDTGSIFEEENAQVVKLVLDQLKLNPTSYRVVGFESLTTEEVEKAIRAFLELASRDGRPFMLLESQVKDICRKYDQVQSVGFVFELLKHLGAAMELDFDVSSLLRDCTSSNVASLLNLFDTCVNFFARGNYPIRMSIQRSWEEVQKSNLVGPESIKKLPSSKELKRKREIKEILNIGGDAPRSLVDGEEEGDNEYENDDDDFESEEEPPTSLTKAVSSTGKEEGNSLIDEVPVYLLGGDKIEPMDGYLQRILGFLASARYGLTWQEIENALAELKDAKEHEIDDDEEEADKATKSAKNLADNSFEEWLMDDVPSPTPQIESGRPGQQVFPEELEPVLRLLVSFFAPISYGEDVHCSHCIPYVSNLRLCVDQYILTCPEFAPREALVEELGLQLFPREQSEKVERPVNSLNNSRRRQFESSSLVEKQDLEPEGSVVSFELENLEARWRLVLTKVFTEENPKLKDFNRVRRKAEELSWLLFQNGHWDSLVNVIVEIPSFLALWGDVTTGRVDLLRYWQTISNSCNSLVKEDEEEDDDDDKVVVKKQQQQKRPCTVVYDPVDLYSRSVDAFHNLVVPNQRNHSGGLTFEALEMIKLVASVINKVGEFFWLFGADENLAPKYLHPPIEENELVSIKIDLPHRDQGRLRAENRIDWQLDLHDTNHALQTLAAERDQMLSEQHLAQRQPTASKAETSEKEQVLAMKRRRSRYIGLLLRQQTEHRERKEIERAREGTRYLGNDHGENFYSYQRWVWIQYPWMALYHASTVRILTNIERSKAVAIPKLKSGGSSNNKSPKTRKRVETMVLARQPSIIFWDRLKKTPNEPPPQAKNHLRSSTIKAATTEASKPESIQIKLDPLPGEGGDSPLSNRSSRSSGSSSSEEEHENDVTHLVPDKWQMKTKREGLEIVCKGVGPFLNDVKRLPQNAVPFSSPSVRTLKHGTRFPTFDADEVANGKCSLMAVFHGGYLDEGALKRSLQSMNELPKPRYMETKPINSPKKSYLLSHVPAHLTSYPMSEHDTRVAELVGMISDFRKELDETSHESDKKEKLLEAMMQEVYERNETDKFTNSCISAGEALIQDLTSRYQQMLQEIAKCEHTNRYLIRVVQVCEDFPARVPKHIENIEAHLSNMREDRIALGKDLDEILLFTKRTLNEQKPRLEVALENRRVMQKQVLDKLKNWREVQIQKHLEQQRRHTRRATIALEVRQQEYSAQQAHKQWSSLHRQQLCKEVLGWDEQVSTEMEEKEMRHKRKILKKLRRAAKTSDVSEIISKFKAQQERQSQVQQEISEAKNRKATLVKTLEELKRIKTLLQGGSSKDRLDRLKEQYIQSEVIVEQTRDKLTRMAAKIGLGETYNVEPQSFAQDFVSKLEQLTGTVLETTSSLTTKPKPLSKQERKKRQQFLFGTTGRKGKVQMPPRINARTKSTPNLPRKTEK